MAACWAWNSEVACDRGLGLGARGLKEGGLLRRGAVAQLLRLGAERDYVRVCLLAQQVALGAGGLDLLVTRTLGRAHEERCLLVGVGDDGRRLLRGAGEDHLGLAAGAAGLGAVALGVGHQAPGLLTQRGEVGGEPLGLLAGLALELVGDLLGTGQQRRRGGLARGGHPRRPPLRVTKRQPPGLRPQRKALSGHRRDRWSEAMKLLVLGGTRFLSREVAAQAVARGWDVTCACRGESGPLPDGATHLRWDRSEPAPAALAEGGWDAVVDVARLPSQVRGALDAAADAHWVFVSTISAYADNSSPATEPLAEPITEDVDLSEDPDAYGGMKVACEQLVQERAASAVVVRPGLIVGPGDPTGRFAHWPQRLVRGGEVLAPGRPDDVVQVIDVRDLAAWVLELAERRTTGTYDAVGTPVPLGELLAHTAAGVGADYPRLTWVDADFLEEHGVAHWAGEGSLPLWLPRPEYDGMLAHDPGPAVAAGLRLRPLAETASGCLDSPVFALSPEREAEVLEAWHTR